MESLFAGAATLIDNYADVDWANTELGPVDTWTRGLRNAVDFALNTRFPVALFWGPDFVMIYNEAYSEMIGEKHPTALGSRARDVFPEIWHAIGPMFQAVRGGKGATWVEDARLPLLRRGKLEERYFTFSYSPVRGDDGVVEGVIDIAAETTRQIVDRRRLELLSRLDDELAELRGPDDLVERALRVLRSDVDDLAAVDIVPLDQQPAAGQRRDLVIEHGSDGRIATVRIGAAADVQHGTLVVVVGEQVLVDGRYHEFLRLIAAALGQARDRITATQFERDMSEALQRSLLAPPVSVPGVAVAVRYQPALEQAQVGGDWYDSFLVGDGKLTVAIGDVSGHDQDAAAGMAQIRNLLRGVSFTLRQPPALVLAALDEAMHGLDVDVCATAVLAQLFTAEAGRWMLQWSNAGHPPPMLLQPDGEIRVLEGGSGVMLGVASGLARSDEMLAIEPGSSVVLYTDGLIERRGSSLDEGLERLAATLRGEHRLPVEQLCDVLLERFAGSAEDDIALLVLRVV